MSSIFDGFEPWLRRLVGVQPSPTDLTTLPDGTRITSLKAKGIPLTITKGSGAAWTATLSQNFFTLRAATQTASNHAVQYALMNLDSGEWLESSKNPACVFFGASVTKAFVGATLMEKQGGVFTSTAQRQHFIDMLVPSDNDAWHAIQTDVGDGNEDVGRRRVQAFAQRMGYVGSRPYQGWVDGEQGNQLTTTDAVKFLYDVYQRKFAGAETLFKIMHTFSTGGSRGNLYIPSSQILGGKTGTYDEGSIAVRHQISFFKKGGVQYGLAVLSNSGTSADTALIHGGLYAERD